MSISSVFDNKITKEQKHATAVLSTGAFLEIFDLYLYMHLAFLLEKEFFPPGFNNNWVCANLSVCSLFIFRPLGAIFFGWLGDLVGRKYLIFVTTIITSSACLTTAFLPTYAEWGPVSAYILLTCRILQGVVSPCEVQGARLYLSETVKTPRNRCFLTSFIDTTGIFGRFAAIFASNIVINLGGNSWRTVFIMGAVVALIGMYARASLKEADEFVEAKKRFVTEKKQIHSKINIKQVNKKDLACFFILRCGEVLALFLAYQYSPKLISTFEKPSAVINAVTLVGAYEVFAALMFLVVILLVVNPLKIARFTTAMCLPIYIVVPILFTKFCSISTITLIQMVCLTFFITDFPGTPVVYLRFPILNRFKIILLFSGCAKAMMWPLCTFGVPFLTNKFGHYGLYVIYLPITIISIFAINYFVKVSETKENHNLSKTIQKNMSFQNA